MTTTTLNQRQPTPLSAGSGTEDPDLPPKKSRKRKSTEKKLVPHSSTLHGLWGKPKRADEQPEAKESGDPKALDAKGDGAGIGGRGLLVFKVSPPKLAFAVQQQAPERMVTPPKSLPDVIPQTPVQAEQEVPKTPTSRSSQKKRSFQHSPTDGVRRSPRNNRRESLATLIVDTPAKKPHPFFLGKEARQALQATSEPVPTIDTTVSEDGEPSRKRQRSSSDQQSASERASLLPPKPIHAQSAKSLHPFFMSRTASMESSGSAMSTPLLPLPQGKTVHLGNGKPAPFPRRGINHVYDTYTDTDTFRSLPVDPPLKQKKGKGKMQANRQGDTAAYSSFINLAKSTTFIPPEKVIMPREKVLSEAKKLLSSTSHHALYRAYKVLCDETRLDDPDGQSWTHKFRPRRANEILSGNPSAIDLRDWMTGNRKVVSSTIPDEMDGFIVDDDDDDDISDDSISEVDDDSPRKRRPRKKELFMSYSNVCILVGAHGVGKSAAVHAVAEELGYQVFEISPGSRRGGKEIMEAVGEVGQSELVTKHKDLSAAPSLSPLGLRGGSGEVKSQGRKALICLDEVDVLYEEDKGFWSCVTGLVEKSRRPIVITCNGIPLLVSDAAQSAIPIHFSNCKVIDFSPAASTVVRDYLHLITLSQGHILDPQLLERVYLEMNRDLRRTLAHVQFWCQFGVGDTRAGSQWINWGGKQEDWVMSRGTVVDGVKWRQEAAGGTQVVLEAVENAVSNLNVDDMVFPQHFEDQLSTSPSPFKRGRSLCSALTGIAEFLDTMSVMDCTVDKQFTAYEIAPFVKTSADDVLTDSVLRHHPGRRFEEPQGGEDRMGPYIRVLARTVLDEKLRLGGYHVPRLSNEKITSQPLKDLLSSGTYINIVPADDRYLTREDIYDPLERILHISTLDDRLYPTIGTLHTVMPVVLDLAPQIRHILRIEHQRRENKLAKTLPQNLWGNIPRTRSRNKEQKEGRKRWFGDKLDHEAVLKTWLDVTITENDTGHIDKGEEN